MSKMPRSDSNSDIIMMQNGDMEIVEKKPLLKHGLFGKLVTVSWGFILLLLLLFVLSLIIVGLVSFFAGTAQHKRGCDIQESLSVLY